VTEQDIKVAGYASDRGCGTIFVLNKWDLVDKKTNTTRQYEEQVRYASKFLSYAPVLTVSALTGQRIHKIFPLVKSLYKQYTTRIGTGQVNRIITNATERTEPPLHKGRRLKFYYTTQISDRPPTFVSFVNYPEAVHFSYQRYLLNRLRTETGLDKVPLRLYFRQRSGRIEFKKKKKRPR
jgi:GTP-binding protein